MNLDIKDIAKAIDEDFKNPDGYWNTLIKKEKAQAARFDKFDKWLETNDFETTFRKLLSKNGENRAEWCYKRREQKYGTPLMQFLCNYVSNRCKQSEYPITSVFQSGIWEFKGYYFELNCGQGCFWRIYDKDLNIVEDV